MFNKSQFNSTPFNSPSSAVLYTFLDALVTLYRTRSGMDLSPLVRPQALGTEDVVMYRLPRRDYVSGVQGFVGLQSLTFEVNCFSMISSTASSMDLEIQQAVDRYSGTTHGHEIADIQHVDVVRKAIRAGNQWLWCVTSTYEVLFYD